MEALVSSYLVSEIFCYPLTDDIPVCRGCVSGEQVLNIREAIATDVEDEYDWDKLDGWEELEDSPEAQEKIERVIKQGHIDPEDFNGDPEFNTLGQKGIRPRGYKKKAVKEEGDEEVSRVFFSWVGALSRCGC